MAQAQPDIYNIPPSCYWSAAARRHLMYFVQAMPQAYTITPFHRSYLRILDAFARGKVKNLIIQAPPQHGKSQLSSRMLPAYLLGQDPEQKITIASYAATIAKDFNKDVQRIMETPEYTLAFPGTRILDSAGPAVSPGNSRRNSEVTEVVGHAGSLRVVGRGGSLTSKTVDVLIMDDLYKDGQEANSPLIREGAWDWYTKVARTRLHNQSRQLIVFTRWHVEDIIGRIMEKETVTEITTWEQLERGIPDGEWGLVNFPAIKVGPPTEIDTRGEGEALWPGRHSLERLKAQRELDPVGFECLYQGNPGNAESRLYHPFKTWVDKADWGSYIRSGCYIDVADEGDDYLASITYDVYRSDSQAWNEHERRWEPLLFILVTDIILTDEGTEITGVTVPQQINTYGSQKVWIESNNGGSQYAKVVRRKVRAACVEFYQGGNKEARVLTSAPAVNNQVIMPLGWETRFPKAYESLTMFLRQFGANAHDDLEDALTGVVEKELGNTQPYQMANRGVTVH